MTAVNVASSFKKDERENNGLEAIAKALIEDPHTRHVIVAVIETSAVRTDYRDGGAKTPTVRFVQIEAVDGSDAEQARAMLDKAFRARTGREDNPAATLFDPESVTDPSLRNEGGQDGDVPAERDPAAGPWPGDADYPDDNGEVAAASTAGRKGRRTAASQVDGE
jgi:hypothetical protein